MAEQGPQSDLQPPSSLIDVEELIQQLYLPGTPQKISKVQEALQTLQRSPQGWQLASLLLENGDEKIRFFGALTFTVKLNSDSSTLSGDDAQHVLQKLVNFLILSLRRGDSPLVIRKLCSTLVVFFLQFSTVWIHCVRHLVECLSTGQCYSAQPSETGLDVTSMLQNMNGDHMLAALWFCTALAEEVGKTDSNNIRHHKFHQTLKVAVKDVVALISPGLNPKDSPQAPVSMRQESMKCFHAWVLYSHRAFIDTAMTLEPLTLLTKQALACILFDDMYQSAAELFCDTLSNYSSFLRNDDMQLLSQMLGSDWARARYYRLIQGDFDFDSMQFGQLMLAFGDATVQDLARRLDPVSQGHIHALGGLLQAEGFAVAEDLIFVQALEFWSTFVETLVDALYSEEGAEAYREEPVIVSKNQAADGPWFSNSQSHVITAIKSCWHKIQYPPPDVFSSWDSAERTGFADARKDVADILQASYTLIGSRLFSMFAEMTMTALGARNWSELESSLYCLGALAECLSDENECDKTASEVFGSPLFSVLTDSSYQVPSRTRQTALSLIGQYDGYFERHSEHLPGALTFLFGAVTFPEFAGTASKSIHSLCSSCRQTLAPQMDAFLSQYVELFQDQDIEGLVKERVVGGIAAIIQAMVSHHSKKPPLMVLLKLNEGDLDKVRKLSLLGEVEESEKHGLGLLRCLVSIAKGLQAPPDIPIELETSEPVSKSRSFWISESGAEVQAKIFFLIENILSLFPRSGDIAEATCNIFRAGFTEISPGPFVFASASVEQFLLRAHPDSSRLGAFIVTACSFVSSRLSESKERVDGNVSNILDWLLKILQHHREPSSDPEIAQAGIDFVYRMIPRYLNVLLNQSPASLEFFFLFSLRALTGKDPLPKNAAAEFWHSFISINHVQEPLQRSATSILVELGPSLAQALVFNFSGNAARSELDKLCEPLRKLIARHVHARVWLENALLEVKVSSQGVITDAEKRLFLQKIIRSVPLSYRESESS